MTIRLKISALKRGSYDNQKDVVFQSGVVGPGIRLVLLNGGCRRRLREIDWSGSELSGPTLQQMV
jgi:hypothetical protein